MAKAKGKQGAVELGPESDPKFLYSNYVKECKATGIEPYGPLKDALTNEDNPNIGKQIIILPPSIEGEKSFGPGGCRALANAMINSDGSLSSKQVPFTAAKEIRICRSSVGDAGASALGNLLAATAKKRIIAPSDSSTLQPWKLEYLELIDNGIGKNGSLALGRSLCVGMNRTLTTLILDFNRALGSDGVDALCKGLSTNSTLKKLSLKHCNIDKGGGKSIGGMLTFKRLGLISLDLTSNQISGSGLIDILSPGLCENKSLKIFRFGDNLLAQKDDDTRALEMFARVLASHPTIMAVDLLHNPIGTNGGTLLLPAVRDNKKLTEFKVDSKMDGDLFKSLFRATSTKKTKKGKGKKKSKKK